MSVRLYCFTYTVTDGSGVAFGPTLTFVTISVRPSGDSTRLPRAVTVPNRLDAVSMVRSSVIFAAIIEPLMTAAPVMVTGWSSHVSV
jgi:hypothetical protein